MRKDRLEKLAVFLDKLKPEEFNINVLTNTCNTVCCAVGWLPAVDPENWEWSESEGVRLRDSTLFFWQSQAMEYFELTEDLTETLFDSLHYTIEPVLPSHVTQRIRAAILSH